MHSQRSLDGSGPDHVEPASEGSGFLSVGVSSVGSDGRHLTWRSGSDASDTTESPLDGRSSRSTSTSTSRESGDSSSEGSAVDDSPVGSPDEPRESLTTDGESPTGRVRFGEIRADKLPDLLGSTSQLGSPQKFHKDRVASLADRSASELLTDMDDEDDETTQIDPTTWQTYTDPASDGPFYVHRELFRLGIVAFTDSPDTGASISKEKLKFGSRHFQFSTLGARERKHAPQTTSSARIFSRLSLFVQKRENKEIVQAGLEAVLPSVHENPSRHPMGDIHQIIREYYGDGELVDPALDKSRSVVVTEGRGDEVFFPLSFHDRYSTTQPTETGSYVYPWVGLPTVGTQAKDDFVKQFDGFELFFTGSCLFGSTLQGIDQHENSFSIIKADLKLFPRQIIDKIKNEKSFQLHEIAQIRSLEKQVSLMAALSKEKETSDHAVTKRKPTVFYHLPGYDYLLMGVDLYIKGHMTLSAFGLFCHAVLRRQELYTHIIEKISAESGVEIVIVSPWEFIFRDLLVPASFPGEGVKAKEFGEAVLSILEIKPSDVVEVALFAKDDNLCEARKTAEERVLSKCIELLTKPNKIRKEQELKRLRSKMDYQHCPLVWYDFIANAEKQVKTLKDLLHVGNTVMVGTVSYKQKNHAVCTFHPTSEKYMFLQYGKYSKLKPDKTGDTEWSQKYPTIFCCTFMDSVQPHSQFYPLYPGQTFYYNRRAGFLLNGKTDLKLLDKAGKNVVNNGSIELPASFRSTKVR